MEEVNLLQYKLFCAKKGRCPCFKLPLCRSSLEQHYLHESYQPKIWRDCIADEFFAPSLEGHGWVKTDDETCITWMDV